MYENCRLLPNFSQFNDIGFTTFFSVPPTPDNHVSRLWPVCKYSPIDDMPTTSVEYSKVTAALAGEPQLHEGCFVSTPLGLAILEIQGELNYPQTVPDDLEMAGNFCKVDDIYDAVKFGKMTFDEKDPNKVTLLIGKSQRLMGAVELLREPLGVLRVSDGLEMIDIIYKKLIFRQRPLPVM